MKAKRLKREGMWNIVRLEGMSTPPPLYTFQGFLDTSQFGAEFSYLVFQTSRFRLRLRGPSTPHSNANS